jgi:hypothetical protein
MALRTVTAALLGISFLMTAQVQDQGPAPAQQAPLLAAEQLDDLVAPIALYPDPLLSQVLVASTYPLEIVEAQQWSLRNRGLTGQQLTAAAREQNWDASVQALVAFPDVLGKLNQDLQWTTALGNAFLAQQPDVMAAVQEMRARAQSNGRLATTPQQTVTTETQNGQAAIEIAPADPQVIYVPTYDPAYVWGPPVYAYPSLFYAGYGFGFGPGINLGFCFGGWGGWGFGGWGWGWGPNWFGRSVFVNGAFFNRYGFRSGFYGGGYGAGFGGRMAWQHDPGHRLGVGYPNGALASRYQAASLASRSSMARSGFNSTRPGNVGASNWRTGAGGASAYGNRAATPNVGRAGGVQSYQGSRYQSGQQSYQGSAQRYQGGQSYQGAGQRYSAPAQNYRGGQSYQAPAQHYSAPAQSYRGGQSYQAPAQHYSAPAQNYRGGQSYSSPRSSAPSYSGGSSRSFSSGGSGGGGSRSYSGGGGGSHSSGGSSHGGGHGR